jgi:N,N'-diacetyllegionaminate synthase
MTISIGARVVGLDRPCFVIAEAGVNHNGDLAMAHALVDAAKAAGADAVKFQTFSAERLVSRTAPKAEYQLGQTDPSESHFEMLRHLELSESDHRELIAHCRDRALLFMSTPFDEEAADLLDELDVPAYKIPSGEITNLPFLAHVAAKQRPIILSTGMSTLAEVEEAVQCLRKNGAGNLVLLQCVSNYPAHPADINLRAMATMAAAFGLAVGYSDHTNGIEIALAAAALGACVIEKHFTLDRNLPGPDHRASLEPGELTSLIEGIRQIESALGNGVKQPAAAELVNLSIARKSVHWRHALERGAVVRAADLIALRPATGLAPGRVPSLVGRSLRRSVSAGEMVSEEDFQ